MKAFEKWQLTSDYYMSPIEAWRAALEWYRETMEEINKHDIPISGEEVIKQELEE